MEDTFFALFPSRLKEERIRLGLTQAKAAELCGVRREAWGQYERGSVAPGAPILFQFASHGADVQYLMTGKRNELCQTDNDESNDAGPLAPEEAALIKNYRLCPADARKALTTTSNLLAQPKGGKLKDVG
jgi:transcriptional regulator with XRE-family HTH domain